MSKSLDDAERRYEAVILRLEGKLADAWDDGEQAGGANQANWDGWRYTKPEITNPYRKATDE